MKSLMKLAVVFICIPFLFLSLNGGGGKQAVAEKQQKPSGSGKVQTPITPEPPKSIGVTATESMAFKLMDSKGQELGQIHDLLCDIASGYVTLMVFDLQVPGVSQKRYYPVPSGLLGFNHAKKTYVIDISRVDTFKNAPIIGGEISPGTFLQAGINIQEIYMYWQNVGVIPPSGPITRSPFAKEAYVYAFGFRILPGAHVSFRGIEGYDVVSPGGQKIGKIENLSYNPFSGKIDYLFVSFEGAPYKGRFYPLPLDAFTLNFSDRTITFDLDQDLLPSAPSISAGQWEKVTNPSWIHQVRKYWLQTSPVAALRQGMRIVPQTVMRETTLLGTEVTNYQGQPLGRIGDFVISDNGNIPYAITDVGSRWCFIPTTVITIDRIRMLALVDIPESRLSSIPGYEPRALPDLNTSAWDAGIRSFWLTEAGPPPNESIQSLIISETPEMAARGTQNFLASAVREYTVRGSDGETLGDIENFLLNMEEADAAYIVIGVGGFLDFGEKLFPIPVGAVNIMPGKDVVLNIQRNMLDEAPGFSSSEWLTMESPEQLKKVSDYWKNILE